MAKLLVFEKKEEDDYYASYEIRSDGFNGELIIDKIYKNMEFKIFSLYEFRSDKEMKENKEEYLIWVVNKRTVNLTVFPDNFNYNS